MGHQKKGKKADPSTPCLMAMVVERSCVLAVQQEYLALILDIGAERERILAEARAEAEMIVRDARDAACVTMSRAPGGDQTDSRWSRRGRLHAYPSAVVNASSWLPESSRSRVF